MKKLVLVLGLLLSVVICCQDVSTEGKTGNFSDWGIGPFQKVDSANPVLFPDESSTFFCPVKDDTVYWESKDVFNPASVVRNDTLFLLYRAEDRVGRFNGTSRIGLAYSTDGLQFTRLPEPVLYPENDFMKPYEWEGGLEDPRIIEDKNGVYYLTYTAYDGETARLCVATSRNLRHWNKQGLAFADSDSAAYADLWSKSGSIITRRQGHRLVAERIDGKYWMYWGDTDIFAATSTDLIHWHPIENDSNALQVVFGPRERAFDSQLVEPGPPALLTAAGIVLIYNSRNHPDFGNPNLPDGTYTAGQALMDTENPMRVLRRTDDYFMVPDKPYEITGQVNNVVFLEGLSNYLGRWYLYYGTADSRIAVAQTG